MLAAWWWIDRWRKSTGYTGLSLEAQAAYRNLLDELWLRDGLLPDDDRVLGNICGDARRWDEVKAAVLAHFTRTAEGWRHPTHDEVAAESQRRRDKQAAYRLRVGNMSGNGGGNTSGNKRPSPSPSPSPSPISGTVSSAKDIVPSALTPTPSEDDGRFAQFWAAYPRKTGKAAALKSWTRLHPTAERLAQMLATLARQRAEPQWTKDAGQFIPHPATWLNQGRWDDEPTVASTEHTREPGTYVMGFRLEDLEKTPEELAAAAEWEKVRARYR
jgi:uncharacterized protein YdaU (DUF1376 family)